MLEKLREIICDYVDIDPELISEQSSLRNDIGASSFDLMNIAVAIEEEYRISLPNNDLIKIKTVGNIITAIESKGNTV